MQNASTVASAKNVPSTSAMHTLLHVVPSLRVWHACPRVGSFLCFVMM